MKRIGLNESVERKLEGQEPKISNEFNELTKEYMPPEGQGTTMATQTITALNKLLYRFYNDGDIPGSNANQYVDSCFKWLKRNIPEFKNFETATSEEWNKLNDYNTYERSEYDRDYGKFYINHLTEFINTYITKDYIEELNKKEAKGDIYSKLNESVERKLESEDVERYREWLKNVRAEYKNLDRNSSFYSRDYNDVLKREKEYIRKLKRAISEERGIYVSPTSLTNAIKKLGELEKYSEDTTRIRGWHSGRGDFTVDTDEYNNSSNENVLYYQVEFYGRDAKEKADKIYNLLKDNGYVVDKSGSDILKVQSYKLK